MTDLMKTLALLSLMAVASPALAQETTTETEATTEEPTEQATSETAPALDLGEEVTEENQVGQLYVKETFGDWTVRCVRAEEGPEPCQINQTLVSAEDLPVAEISLYPLPEGQPAAAGATIITPLLTLLTEQITIKVDNGTAKKYGFSWCESNGCYARVGFTAEDISAFKRGANATISIVPVAAPDQRVTVQISLTGFTAGYDSLSAAN